MDQLEGLTSSERTEDYAEEAKESSNPWEFLVDINTDKKDLLTNNICSMDTFERVYNPFVYNRLLSYHEDCVFYVNEINLIPDMPKKWQYDFLRTALRPRNRRGKLFRPEQDKLKYIIIDRLGVTSKVARQIMNTLSESDLSELTKDYVTGGQQK